MVNVFYSEVKILYGMSISKAFSMFIAALKPYMSILFFCLCLI